MILLVFALIIVLCRCSDKNVKNKEHSFNNKSLIEFFSSSSSYIAKHNDLFYFANSADDNKIYQADTNMKNFKKISNKANSSNDLLIQFVDNKLFYLQSSGDVNSQNLVGKICCYDFSKNSEKIISKRNICDFVINDKKLYYSTFDTKSIYSSNLDGLNEKVISNNEPDFSYNLLIYNNNLFSCSDEGVYKRDLNGKNVVSQALYPQKMLVYDDKIFFTSDNEGLRQISVKSDTFSNEKILINDDVVDFAVSNETLYFSTSKNLIYKSDLNGKEKELVAKGSKPILIGKRLFYIGKNGKVLN